MKKDNYLVIENASIIFRNFSGKATKFNAEGNRNFCVFVDPASADNLIEDGWNVKFLKAKEEGEEDRPYIPVSVRFNTYPPTIFLISGNNKTRLDEDDLDMLDWAEIQNVDLIIRPYSYEVNGKSGVKAYLKNMYVTIIEDPFASKYSLNDDELPF